MIQDKNMYKRPLPYLKHPKSENDLNNVISEVNYILILLYDIEICIIFHI